MWDVLRAALVIIGLGGAAAFLQWRDEETVAGLAQAIDGDTLRVDGTVVRLKGLDAPELQQTCERNGESYRCGDAARSALARLAGAGVVTCRVSGQDRYRRALARCSIRDDDVGARLVERGLAVGYGAYRSEEARARADKVGLWSGTFQKPEDWRREHRPSDGS